MHIADKRAEETALRYFEPFIKVFSGCGSVLELGSGQGFFLDMLRDAGIKGTGLELDRELCDLAAQRGLKIINRDIFEFIREAGPGEYDGCFASHIVEHMLPGQVEEVFALLYKALKPGAPFVVITPNIANIRRSTGDFWRDPSHVRPYPISALSNLLRRQGFEIVSSGEHSDRRPSIRRKLAYGLRNLLLGRYWVGDDVYVIAKRPS